jgi:UDP-glucose 4-epimerase
MVSEEECHRTIARGDYYVILPMLPELRDQEPFTPALTSEYSSSAVNLEGDALRDALAPFMAAAQ